MGARDLLDDMSAAGFSITADGDNLLVMPASKLNDVLRQSLRECKAELIALLVGRATLPATPCNRPYRLSPAASDRCHDGGWDDAEIAQFVARVALFMRRGIDAADADDLAERLTLRDRDADDRVICAECSHYRPGRCGNHRSALLATAEVGGDLAVMLQRCPGFQSS